MSNSINNSGSTSGVDALAASRLQSDQKKKNALNQDDFLKLMITQMKNQDPSKPMDSNEFVSQMAQFSQVTGIKDLQTSFSSLATSLQSNQALQASSMVGREVLAQSDALPLAAGANGAGFGFELANAASEVDVSVLDGAGQTVRTLKLGQTDAGIHQMSWDGLASDGSQLPPGTYKLKVDAVVDGKKEAGTALARVAVASVSLPRNGAQPQLNLAGGYGTVGIDNVRRVY